MSVKSWVLLFCTILACGVFLAFAGDRVFAEVAPAQILLQIGDQEKKIADIEAEIASYEKELVQIGSEKQTLQGAVRELDLSKKKVQASIRVEEKKITALDGEIADLGGKIGDAETTIDTLKDGMRALVVQMNIVEETTILETLLRAKSIDGLWSEVDSVGQVNVRLRARVSDIAEQKKNLASAKQDSEGKRSERLNHQATLLAQRRALDVTQREKKTLLESTNSKESAYQKQLEEKRVAKAEFEASLRELESQLKYTLDPTRIPPAGKGVLAWPLANVFITQKFGKTVDARRLYTSGTHNGMDFRASIGTPVMSALSGTITATGDTDGGGCYSYGKWILVRHNNGLSTLYAHLSSIMVSAGQSVATREIIGLSGYSGYATGPHLHLSLLVSDGVQVKNLGDWYRENSKVATTACAKKGAIIPIAASNVYLDPLEYL